MKGRTSGVVLSPNNASNRIYRYTPGVPQHQPYVSASFATAQPMVSYPTIVYPTMASSGAVAPRGQIHGAHENLRRVLDDNKSLETKIERLQGDLSEMKSQNESLNSQVIQLTQENAELRDELAIYEKARNHPLVGEAVRSLTRNVNYPPTVEPAVRHHQGWCWT